MVISITAVNCAWFLNKFKNTTSHKKWINCKNLKASDWFQSVLHQGIFLASCVYIVFFRQWILILKAKKLTTTKKEKSPNHHKNTRYSQRVSAHFWRALSALPELRINLWLAVKAPLFRALLFSLVTPRLRERGSEPFPEAAKQQRNRTKG